MSESIVKVVRGSQLKDPSKYGCEFCSEDSEQIFGVTVKNTYQGTMIRHYAVCKRHLMKLNALLSGEFNIDEIYLEALRKKPRKAFKIRKHPGLKISKSMNNKYWKECQFPGCTNKFIGVATKKYCNDERCREMRKLAASRKPRKKIKDKDADNLILPTKLSKKIKKGKVLTLRCRARNGDGCRCKNTFTTIYDPGCSTYPKYCSEHRTKHRRNTFAKRRKDAKNNIR